MRKPERRKLIALECGRHAKLLLPSSVQRRPASALHCRQCSKENSRLEREARQVLDACGCTVVSEWCGLPGLRKRFDYFLVAERIAIEVDGPHHFSGDCYGVPWWEQYARDRRVDAACMQAGLRLVRLHHADREGWARTVQLALSCPLPIIYSPSYFM